MLTYLMLDVEQKNKITIMKKSNGLLILSLVLFGAITLAPFTANATEEACGSGYSQARQKVIMMSGHGVYLVCPAADGNTWCCTPEVPCE